MRAPSAVLGLLVAGQAVAGEFCWDAVPGATRYNLYTAGMTAPMVVIQPDGTEWYDNRPTPWVCHANAPASVCGPAVCCAQFADAPGNFVYYLMTADNADPGSESLPVPNPCP